MRSAGKASAAVMTSRLTGLVREITLARLFGAGAAFDAYTIGFRIPNLTRDLFAEGALSAAFVPTLTRTLEAEGKERAAHLANLVATMLLLVVGLLCILGIVFSPQLVGLLAGEFASVPGKFEMAVSLTRVMFPFLLLVAFAAQAMGVLNANNQFGVPALASTFFNIGSLSAGVVGALWIAPRMGFDPIFGMAWGVVIGGGVQWLWQVPAMARHGFQYRLAWDFRDPGLRQILAMMGPAILGTAAVQINVMVNTDFAAGIRDASGQVMNGPVSWLSYAFRFMQLPLGLFGVAISSATLPSLSRSAGTNNIAEFRELLSRSLGMVLLLTVPSAVGLAVLGEPMIAAVYEGGRFVSEDTRQTALALACYAVGLAGYAGVKVLAPALYALDDSRSPMVVSLISIGVNYAAASTMVAIPSLRHAGLALATSTVAIFSFLALFEVMRRRIGGVNGRALWASFAKIVAASAVMGAVCFAASRTLGGWLGTARLARVADAGLSVLLGVAVFYLLCRWMRVRELDAAVTALAGPWKSRVTLRETPKNDS